MTTNGQDPADTVALDDAMAPSEARRRPLALDSRFRCGMARHMSEPLWRRLGGACTEIRRLPPRACLSKAGDPLRQSALLLEGIMVRYVGNVEGARAGRQLVSMQLPGDFVDLHALPLERLDHDVCTLTMARVALFPHGALREFIAADPEDARTLWKLTMIDASIHRHWIYRGGTLRAMAAMADFICEMHARMGACGLVKEGRVPLPMLHSDLAEICGISNVHVSRVVKDLRDGGLCTLRDGVAEIHDGPALRRLAGFDPAYLYLPCAESGPL